VIGLVSIPHAEAADAPVPMSGPTYNPYPPGILPSDLASEIARVQRETQFIFNEALRECRVLPPPTPVDNPPTLHGTGYEAVVILGKHHVALQE
jgi:hypothetical protein